ncbi:unannotated protein [freshwater metagenome]|uniref:Unannotated protein n=1 Tax=freshwater metagenome TaxID=449393 RepID=A0A6J7EWI2_9ZZZZ|nr:hypothetical protein [Actinomycetota bacterium]
MLTLALICTAVGMSVNWFTKLRPNPTMETVSKPIATALVMWVAVAADGPRTATVLAVVGLVFCLIGDIALLDVVDRFVVGLGSFLIGHLVFIAMFVTLHLHKPLWGIAAAAVLAVHAVTVGRRIIAGAVANKPELTAPVLAYLVIISAMAVVAPMTGRWWAVAGAAAFVLSDTLLGWREFVGKKPWFPLAVMVTYHAALVGLALSLR